MADENVVTNIVATADFSDLIGNVNRLNTELAQLKQNLTNTDKALALQAAKLQQTFSSTLRSTGQFSTHFVSLSSDVEKFGKNLDSGKLKLRDYYSTWQGHQKTAGGLIRDLAKQQVQLQNAILQPLGRNAEGLMQFNVQVPRGLDLTKNKAALLKQEMQIMNKVIQDGGVQLINWGKNTQWAGRQLTVGLTLPLAAFGKAAADAFKVADQELVRLTKVYGGVAQTSAVELAKVRREVSATAKELAQAYGSSYTETIALAADIAATGKQGKDLIKSTEETTRLAILGEVDRQEAMKATLSIQTAFKQNTEQLTESINFLNAVENQTSTSLADLVEAIPKAGPIIQSLGGSVQDLALYLTAMKEGGVNASEGANAIKSSLASLINPTKVAKEMFQGFGISLEDIVNSNAGNLTGMMLDLQSSLDKLDPLQKSRAIEQLFGKFQFARMSALFENLGKQGSQTLQVLDLMKASSQDLANVAGRELAQITESASGKYRRAIEGLKADLAGVGESFLNIQTALIGVIDKVIDFGAKLPDPIKKILTLVGGLTALAGPAIMLTGVLANFFGYIIKGAAHFKALFKGGEGWKLLTPEILAAQKAGNLMETTFYSDAKAANILGTAIANLNTELTILSTKAAGGTISSQPIISTVAGTTLMGGGREVIPNHPLISERDTRSFSHLNPVSRMTAEQKSAQTIFGVVPGAPLVNQKISNNPQMYMSGDMPKVEGLTSIRGASTGIVAGEAAKFHSMTGALGMQSQQEIDLLKREVAATGLITQSLSESYQALLPEMTQLTNLAAAESAAIVAELQTNKINIDQARAKIVALNANVEAMMGEVATNVAASQGRSINLTQLPLVNQPAFDPLTGKANMKELTRPRNRNLINKIAGVLGVKTFGAPYSIETTRPKRFKLGGPVYLQDGGPSGTDTVPAWLTAGEYVLRKEAVESLGTDLLDSLNQSGKSALPELGINPQDKPVGAHASLPMRASAHELPGLYGDYLPRGTEAFAAAMPDHPVQVFDRNILGLYDKENQALRKGMRGLTRLELIRALSARDDRLFKYLPGMDKETKRAFKRNLLRQAASLPEGRVYHDDALAKIYQFAKQDTARTLPTALRSNFIEVMGAANVPKGYRPESFKTYVGDQSLPVMTAAEAKAASGKENFFYTSPTSASGKSGKTTVIVTDASGNKHSVTTSGSKLFKKGITQEPSMRRPLNTKKIPMSLSQVLMNTKFRRGYAEGGLVGGASPRYYEEGSLGGVSAYKEGLRNPYGKGVVSGMSGKPMGIGSQMAIGMGGMLAGQAVGGNAGMAIMMASNIIPMMTAMKGFGSLIPSVAKVASILGRLTIPGAIIGTLTGVIALVNKFRKDAEDAGEVNRAMFGGTKEQLAEVGIQYTSVADRIKNVREELELTKAKAESNYQSMTSSGVPGLNLTITQLKEGIKDAKENAKDTVELFNNVDSARVNDLAVSMKAQYVSLGMSVQDATNKIFTLVSASNKSSQALSAITSTGFKEIKDRASAATTSVRLLGKVVSDKSLFNVEEFATGLDAVLNNLNSYMDSLVGTKVDGKMITEADAFKQTIDEIKSIKSATQTIDEQNLQELKRQDLVLGSMLSNSESILSVFAKYKLYLSGLSDVLNIGSMTGEDAIAAASGYEALQEAAQDVVGETAIGKAAAAAKKAAEAAASSAKKAQNVDSSYYDQAIKNKQKLIDKLEEERKKRLEILDLQQQSEDFETSIKQAQMKYQDAIASGNMAQAAQEQLTIQKLSADRQRELARNAINDKADADRKKLEDEISALQDKKDSLQKAIASTGKQSTVTAASYSELNKLKTDIANIAAKYAGSPDKGIKEIMKVLADAKTAGGAQKVAAEQMIKDYTGRTGYIGSQLGTLNPYQAMMSDLGSKATTSAKADGTFANAVDLFLQAVKDFKTTVSPTASGSGRVTTTPLPGGVSISSVKYSDLPPGTSQKIGTVFTASNGVKYKITGPADRSGSIPVKKMAYGGYISGAGNGTSDSIPAMLSNGEYVINAKSVQAAGIPMLDRINKMAMGGPVYNVPAYSTGGRVKYNAGGSASTSNALYNINVTLNGTDLNPNDVARAIDNQMKLREAMNGRGRNY